MYNLVVDSLQDLIQRYVPLDKPNAKGWMGVRCASCNDHKVRGAFNFSDCVVYSCFNCGLKTGTKEASKVSRKLADLLISFGIPEDELHTVSSAAALEAFKRSPGTIPVGTPIPKAWAPPKEVAPAPGWVTISGDASPWCEVAREYLLSRALPPDCYGFYVTDDPKYEGRLLIPYYYRGQLVYWQGRAFDGSVEPRYKNPMVDKEKVIFNYDSLSDRSIATHYVAEGALDALSIGPSGIALSDSNLSEWRLRELQRSTKQGKRFVFVLDKNPNGLKLGLQALSHGWLVATMPDGIDDSNDCRKKLGQLWLLNHLVTTAAAGFAGEVLLKIKCK